MDFTAIINNLGMHSEKWVPVLNIVLYAVVLVLTGWVTLIVTQRIIGPLIVKLTRRTKFKWDNLVFDHKLFLRLGWLLAPITIRFVLSFVDGKHIGIILDLVETWIIIASAMFISTVMYRINRIWDSLPGSKDRPIRIFIQLIIIFVWCAAVIVIISLYTGVKVGGLLGGLTAFAAVLILVFQDTILGFVAGIQMNANKMVRVGDWIEMPGRGVDGDVTEIGLNTVKVQNWDKTIVTIPTHKLVQESFTNWRGMSESGGRRIKRSVNIDVKSIRHLTEDDLAKLRGSDMMKDYIEKKINEITAYNAGIGNPFDERHLTNIGTFREYLEAWLARNPNINKTMTYMVRQLQPGPTGLPLEIYCFSANQEWIAYERIQADIFDHVFAVMGLFGLRAYEYGMANHPVN